MKIQYRAIYEILVFAIMLFLMSVKPIATSAQNQIDITIIYAPESEQYMPQIINRFNAQACENGIDPNTNSPLPKPICISGRDASSGVIMQQIVDAIADPNNPNLARPTIFQPSVTHCPVCHNR